MKTLAKFLTLALMLPALSYGDVTNTALNGRYITALVNSLVPAGTNGYIVQNHVSLPDLRKVLESVTNNIPDAISKAVQLYPVIRYALVTNVTRGDNHSGCSANSSFQVAPGIISTPLIWHPWHEGCVPYVSPTERWVKTEIGLDIVWELVDPATGKPDGTVTEFRRFIPIKTDSMVERLESTWKKVGKIDQVGTTIRVFGDMIFTNRSNL